MFRPAGLLATPVASTEVLLYVCRFLQPAHFLPVSGRVPHLAEPWTSSRTGQSWLFLPSTPQFVTSLCPGYASRLNRAIDGRGLSPHKIRSLIGCSHNSLELSGQAKEPSCVFAAVAWSAPARRYVAVL